jgi:uncharacterized protein (DUF3084 family)
MRTREELVAVIEGGGSVLLPDGTHVDNVENLPSEVALAGSDVPRLEQEERSLRERGKAIESALQDIAVRIEAAKANEKEVGEREKARTDEAFADRVKAARAKEAEAAPPKAEKPDDDAGKKK